MSGTRPAGEARAVSPERDPGSGRRWLRAVLVGVGAVAAVLLVRGLSGAADLATQRAEHGTVVLRYLLRGPRATHGDVVVVALDHASREREPALFRTRAGMASLLRAIAAARPRVIALDLFYEEPEELLPPAVVDDVTGAAAALRASGNASPPARRALHALEAVADATRGDAKLAAAVASAGNVVLAGQFFPGRDENAGPESLALSRAALDEYAAMENPPQARPEPGRDFRSAIEPVARAAKRIGHVNLSLDATGMAARIPAVIERGTGGYAALSLAALAVASTGGTAYVSGARELRVGPYSLPVDSQARAMLDFYGGAGSFPAVSAADLLEGKTPRSALEGKIVFVGYADASHDVAETPFDVVTDGVELHATLAENVIHGEVLRELLPRWEWILALALGIGAASACAWRSRPSGALAIVLALAGGWLVVVQAAFLRGWILPAAFPAFTALVAGAAGLATVFVEERREKTFLRRTFSQYVSSAVVDRILEDPAQLRLGGERRELTMLFSDIRGFSRVAESLEPAALTRLLDEYFGPMSALVLAQGGTVDKYIGDALMAFWGAPIEVPDHARRACAAALEMLRTLGELNERWRANGLPELKIGIGLNTGLVSVGNMGSEARFAYTVLGDAVNLASRLETLTKEYGASILAGDRVRELAGDGFVWRELDRVRVVGREGVARVYELLGTVERCAVSPEAVLRFDQAMTAYRARDWEAAEKGFAEALAARPADGPAAAFLERVRALRSDPPPADWDGVYTQRSK